MKEKLDKLQTELDGVSDRISKMKEDFLQDAQRDIEWQKSQLEFAREQMKHWRNMAAECKRKLNEAEAWKKEVEGWR